MISENMMLLYASIRFVVGVQLYNPVLSGFRVLCYALLLNLSFFCETISLTVFCPQENVELFAKLELNPARLLGCLV
jgi:hypothetical protein